jgi:hypothetical protein
MVVLKILRLIVVTTITVVIAGGPAAGRQQPSEGKAN